MMVEYPRLLGKAMAVVTGILVAAVAFIILMLWGLHTFGKPFFAVAFLVALFFLAISMVYDELVRRERYK